MNWLDLIGAAITLGLAGVALFVVGAGVVYVVRTGSVLRGVLRRMAERQCFIAARDQEGRRLRYRIDVPRSVKLTDSAYNSLFDYLRTRTRKDAPTHLVYKAQEWQEVSKPRRRARA